jgi:hypothetical protein
MHECNWTTKILTDQPSSIAATEIRVIYQENFNFV